MKTINKLKAKVEELHKFIEGNTMLSVKISASSYPLQIKFYESQIDLLSEEAPRASAPSLCFVFDDEMRIVTTENFKIDETTFSKIKNLSKEINRLYLHSFREEAEKVIKPIWNTINGSQIALYGKSYFDTLMNKALFEE